MRGQTSPGRTIVNHLGRSMFGHGVAAMDHELQIKCNELLKRIKHLQDSL